MFDLNQAIAAWRLQMAAGGVESAEILDEMESHLRDELTQQAPPGPNAQHAFDAAVERFGHANLLKTEFDKIGGISGAPGKIRRAIFGLAGIPAHYLMLPTKTPNSHLEPRWVTYFKASAFLAPAIFVWTAAAVFMLPKLNQIYYGAHIEAPGVFPGLIRFNSAILSEVKDNLLYIFALLVVTLILLEWRSSRWPNYRRRTIGTGVFLLNTATLFSVFIIILTAVFTAASLFEHAK